jgi:vacuolar-type H+-ATPase subunit I/STV1
MIKKTLLVATGGLLVLGLLFGRNLIPYAGTAVNRVQSWADSKIDTSYKIDTARKQLESVGKSIEPMMYEIARQKLDIGRLAKQIESQDADLARAKVHIQKLRDHLASGEAVYVSTSSGRSYSTDRVESDLSNQIRRYRNGEQQVSVLRQTLELREKGLYAAEKNLEETLVRQRTLATEIDNLEAQARMLDVRKTASDYARFDDSALSRANEMIDEIRSRLEAEAMMLDMGFESLGDIPMEQEEDTTDTTDVIEQADAILGGAETSSMASR